MRIKDQIEENSSQLLRNLSSCEKNSPEKNSGLNGIRTHDLCDAGAVLYQLRYQANWELVIFVYLHLFIHPLRVYYVLTTSDQLQVGLIAQLVEHCTGFESRSSLKFFQAFFSQLLKLRSNCEDLSSI